MVAAQVAGGDAVEGLPGAGAVPGVVERGGQGVVVAAGADAAGEFDGRGIGGAQLVGVLAPGDLDLLAGPGFPAQPDADLGRVAGDRGDGDVGEQGAQQPLAVFIAGGRVGPQGGQVRDGRGELVRGGQLGLGRALRGQCGLGVGQASQPGLPAGFQGAGDQPVLRLAGQEGALKLKSGDNSFDGLPRLIDPTSCVSDH